MMSKRVIFVLLLIIAASTATAAPSWVERAKDKFSLGPVVGQEYRLNGDGDFKSTGLLTVGAVHYSIEEYWTLFAFYGLSNRTIGQNHQVAGGGTQYTDFIGVTFFGGADVDEGVIALQYATSWFIAFGIAFNGFEFGLEGSPLTQSPISPFNNPEWDANGDPK